MGKVHIDLNNKSILVTGSPGFIGANLVQRLLQDAEPVTIVNLDNVNGYYDGIVEFIKHIADEGFMRREHAENLIVSDDAKDLLAKMEQFEPADVTKWVVEIKEQVK